ncbi:MAG TPA: protein kinase [Candidatus Polarisedimenticolia bacterium]|nr:protein kinase [Candidatus Polarisedimenticolia bacterium]
MTLAPGSRLGPYEILSPLGAGGMGEVFRARDTRLGREVAVKVLPARVAGDAEALARFEREARAVASLSHPNILAIHDFGREGEIAYSVTELVEGETLRARLADGPLPVRKAVDCAQQVARGLAAAHDKGVVHRDLKPENIIVTSDGRVKILDFGLAKTALAAPGDLTDSPTVQAGTMPGTVLGTLGYMSPEQVRGQALDHRTDIFSFGLVLHEMLTARPVFRRDTAADTMSAILKEDPPELSPVNRAVSPALERIVLHCLEKNPAERFQSARDLAFHLEAVMGGTGSASAIGMQAPAAMRRGIGRPLLFAAGVALGLAAGAGAMGWLRQPASIHPPSLQTLTYSGADSEPAASPDGRLVAYTSDREGGTRIWLKQFPGGDEVALTRGPEDWAPRISPDGTQVLFTRGREGATSLYKVAIVGGEPRKLLDDALDGDWSPDGQRIVFLRQLGSSSGQGALLGIVDAAGQGAREITRVQNMQLAGPRWAPDGARIAVVQRGTENSPYRLLVVDADSGKSSTLLPPPPLGRLSTPVWMASGASLLYAKSETFVTATSSTAPARLFLHEIDSGHARSVLTLSSMAPVLDVLRPGTLVLGTATQRQNLREVPLAGSSGDAEARWLTRGASLDRQPTFSPDGQWILFSSNRSGNLDLWKLSRETGTIRRITEEPAEDWDPAFTPDGKSILWSSNRSGHFEIWSCDADGAGARQLSQDGYDAENPTATPDGWVVYNSGNPAHSGIWKMRSDGTQATLLVPGSWSTPDVSPNGTHVAFRSATLPRTLYVARVSDGEQVIAPIALPGSVLNARPRWTPDGRALVFIGHDEAGRRGVYLQRFEPGQDTSPTRRAVAGFEPEIWPDTLGVSPDGARLIFSTGDSLESLILVEGVEGVAPPARRR